MSATAVIRIPEAPPAAPKLQPEPWLRGDHQDLPPILRAVIHALELAKEDIARWCADLTGAQLTARPLELEPVSFHLRHIARSLDRLLTYAEGRQLDAAQFAALRSDMEQGGTREEILAEFNAALSHAATRVRAFTGQDLDAPRAVGQRHLPTTLAGLLIHIAEHSQRHVGQAVTTAKVVTAVTPGEV